MPSLYGDEHKDRLENHLSDETQKALAYVLGEMRLIILNASLWHCQKPWNVPPRRISDNLVLILVSGALDVQVAETRRTITPGDCVFVPENERHAYTFHRGCSACTNFILHALPLYPTVEQPFRGFDSYFQRLKHPEACFERLYRGVALRNLDQNEAFAYVSRILQEIILDAAADGHYRPVGKTSAESRIRDAYWYIHENFAADFGIRQVAAAVGLKEVQFRRIFRRETGFAPNAYIHRLRLLHSARLLTRYDHSLKEVARQSGFNSVSYFCSSFAKYFKCTPESYRKKQRT